MSTMKSFQIVSVAATLAALSASCSSSTSPAASVYLTTNVGTDPLPGGHTATCNIDEPNAPFFSIGTMGTPVSNGGVFALPGAAGGGESGVTVDCVVHPDGNGFDVNVQVSQGEADAFSFNTTTPLTDTPGAQSGVSVSLGLTVDSYGDSTDCTFTLSPEGMPSITAGRIWGTVTCPTATYAEVNATCYATATFILQNCSE
jgi:hypothetical protein